MAVCPMIPRTYIQHIPPEVGVFPEGRIFGNNKIMNGFPEAPGPDLPVEFLQYFRVGRFVKKSSQDTTYSGECEDEGEEIEETDIRCDIRIEVFKDSRAKSIRLHWRPSQIAYHRRSRRN